MKFVIWFIKSTIVHVLLLLTMLIIAITWEAGYDKTIALHMIIATIAVLVVGKLIYYRKYARKSTNGSKKSS